MIQALCRIRTAGGEAATLGLVEAAGVRLVPGLDLSVEFHGHRAATPLGPAAGPHGQLAQNIALSWLAGSRIMAAAVSHEV